MLVVASIVKACSRAAWGHRSRPTQCTIRLWPTVAECPGFQGCFSCTWPRKRCASFRVLCQRAPSHLNHCGIRCLDAQAFWLFTRLCIDYNLEQVYAYCNAMGSKRSFYLLERLLPIFLPDLARHLVPPQQKHAVFVALLTLSLSLIASTMKGWISRSSPAAGS